MPYFSNEELPSDIRARLPGAAQNTYREAYNRALQTQLHNASRKQIADRIAWEAVRHKHQQPGAEWVSQPEKPTSREPGLF